MGKHHKHHKRGKGILSLLITAFVLQLIWNALVPDLFNGPELTYIQAMLIILIKRLISGGMHCGVYKGSYDWDKQEWNDWKEKWGSCDKEDWKNHFEAKWEEKDKQEEEKEAEARAQAEAQREKDEIQKGFKKDGKFDVNVVDVEDAPDEDEDEEDSSQEDK